MFTFLIFQRTGLDDTSRNLQETQESSRIKTEEADSYSFPSELEFSIDPLPHLVGLTAAKRALFECVFLPLLCPKLFSAGALIYFFFFGKFYRYEIECKYYFFSFLLPSPFPFDCVPVEFPGWSSVLLFGVCHSSSTSLHMYNLSWLWCVSSKQKSDSILSIVSYDRMLTLWNCYCVEYHFTRVSLLLPKNSSWIISSHQDVERQSSLDKLQRAPAYPFLRSLLMTIYHSGRVKVKGLSLLLSHFFWIVFRYWLGLQNFRWGENVIFTSSLHTQCLRFSYRQISVLFAEATQSAPCVLFFDEVDGIFSIRSSMPSESSESNSSSHSNSDSLRRVGEVFFLLCRSLLFAPSLWMHIASLELILFLSDVSFFFNFFYLILLYCVFLDQEWTAETTLLFVNFPTIFFYSILENLSLLVCLFLYPLEARTFSCLISRLIFHLSLTCF